MPGNSKYVNFSFYSQDQEMVPGPQVLISDLSLRAFAGAMGETEVQR